MTIGERIKELRNRMGMSQVEFADKINVSKQTLYKYENNKITNIPSDKIEAIAKLSNVSPAYLMGWESETSNLVRFFDNIFPIQTKSFPLLGEIACGEPIFANEDRESYVVAGADIKADFCLKCKGNSMINARIHDGDIVFVRKQSMVDNGEIAAVLIENEATLKRVFYYPDKAKLVLQAENPSFEPLVYIGEEIERIEILGKAVAFQSDVK